MNYVNDRGQVFILYKSFSDEDHLVQYQIEFEDEEGYTCEDYTEPRYFKGKLVKEKNFKIKNHESLVNLQKAIDYKVKERNDLEQEIKDIRTKRNSLRDATANDEVLKTMFDMVNFEKRFLVTIAHWGIRVYDTQTKKINSNAGYDEDGEDLDFGWREYGNFFDFNTFRFTIDYNQSFYGNNEFRVIAKTVKKRESGEKDWENECTVFFSETPEEIQETLIKFYREGKFNRSRLTTFFNELSFTIPSDVKKEIEEENLQRDIREIENLEKTVERQMKELEDTKKRISDKKSLI